MRNSRAGHYTTIEEAAMWASNFGTRNMISIFKHYSIIPMRFFIPVIVVSIFLFSCNPKNKVNDFPKIDYLSNWFIQNEDSLYAEFMNLVSKDALAGPRTKNSWTVRAFLQYDTLTYMGKFTVEARKYCDSIQVVYSYKNTNPPESRILLSIDYNKRFVRALDTIMNLPVASKYFKIQKYEPREGEFETNDFSFENGDVYTDSLRGVIENRESPYNITVFIAKRDKNAKLLVDLNNGFAKSLFGEELLVKKIGTVKFKYSDTIKPGLTIKQLVDKLEK